MTPKFATGLSKNDVTVLVTTVLKTYKNLISDMMGKWVKN